MKNIKKILLVILAFILVFAIASCGGEDNTDGACTSCVDKDGNGLCDVCEKEIPEEDIAVVPLFENGLPTFHIVLAKSSSEAVTEAVNRADITVAAVRAVAITRSLTVIEAVRPLPRPRAVRALKRITISSAFSLATAETAKRSNRMI